MHTSITRAGAIIIMMVMVFMTATQARSEEGCPKMGSGMAPSHAPAQMPAPPISHGLMLLQETLTINVLADLTGLPVENIRQLLLSAPPDRILDEYNVPMDAFANAMDDKTIKLINQSTTAGLISKKQSEDIVKKLNRKPMRLAPGKPNRQ